MNGIVKQVQGNGSIDLKHGTFYKYEVSIEVDGKTYTGEYLSKSDKQNKFVQGQDCHFEHNIVNGFSKIKPINLEFANQSYSKPSNNTSKDTIIARQSSLKCAVDYVIANGGDVAEIIEIADALTSYVIDGTKPKPAPNSNDLPF